MRHSLLSVKMATYQKLYYIRSLSPNNVIYQNFRNATYYYPRMSAEKISPEFYNYSLKKEKDDDYLGKIVTENLISFKSKKFETIVKNDVDKFKQLVKHKIQKMHDLDVGHGDLHLGNILIRELPYEVFIIDWDTAYQISTGQNNEKVVDWWQENYGFETYQEFVNYDLTGWEVDLEDLLAGP